MSAKNRSFNVLDIEQNSKLVINFETLVDPINLAIIFVYLFKVKRLKAIVFNVDFLQLQGYIGGYLPDDNGIYSFSGCIDNAWEEIESNNRLDDIKKAESPNLSLISPQASYSLISNCIERGFITLVDDKSGSVHDGRRLLVTGYADIDDGSPEKNLQKLGYIENKNGFLSDILVYSNTEPDEEHFLKEKYKHLPPEIIRSLLRNFGDFRSYALNSRLQTIGIAARQNIPVINSDPFFNQACENNFLKVLTDFSLNSQIKYKQTQLNIQILKVKDILSLIDRSHDNELSEALYIINDQIQETAWRKEDFKIFLANIGLGLVPFVGTGVTLASYLYQRLRKKRV